MTIQKLRDLLQRDDVLAMDSELRSAARGALAEFDSLAVSATLDSISLAAAWKENAEAMSLLFQEAARHLASVSAENAELKALIAQKGRSA